jgi:hypothetical protein
MCLTFGCIANSDAKIQIATKDETMYMGSYRFDVRWGDRILMMGNCIIAILTPGGPALNRTSLDREARRFLAGLRGPCALVPGYPAVLLDMP